jgi:DNA adenine methylase
MKQSVLKTPISYYGGKQKLVSTILPMIPVHAMYAEPFIGGGAIFFSKPPSHIEVINDTNKELINFYHILQNRFVELDSMVKVTLHSRTLHKDASVVYEFPHLFNEGQKSLGGVGIKYSKLLRST